MLRGTHTGWQEVMRVLVACTGQNQSVAHCQINVLLNVNTPQLLQGQTHRVSSAMAWLEKQTGDV